MRLDFNHLLHESDLDYAGVWFVLGTAAFRDDETAKRPRWFHFYVESVLFQVSS